MPRPIVLVHGYSDTGKGFELWKKILEDWNIPTTHIHVGTYVSLTNEVTIKDLAEGFDRALLRAAGIPQDCEFDAIVHSTGMLVMRSWLNSKTSGALRRARLKHLIALAPATNGSPLAKQGRSWLGSVFKGNKQLGPDFMEAGDEILFGLELGSKFTWDLAHDDLFSEEARFKPGPDSPHVFTFCGNKDYGLPRSLVTNEEGTDGTVRWAGCALNSTKITINLATSHGNINPKIKLTPWENQDNEVIFISNLNHGTILSDPNETLQKLVKSSLNVETSAEYKKWHINAISETVDAKNNIDEWQQFVIRISDERGDSIPDWNLKVSAGEDKTKNQREFSVDVHTYKKDPSLRCFHVNLTKLKQENFKTMEFGIIASSGTELVTYHGHGSDKISPDLTEIYLNGKYDAKIDMSVTLSDMANFKFFYPFTTTFVEIILNREPMPMVGLNKVCWFD